VRRLIVPPVVTVIAAGLLGGPWLRVVHGAPRDGRLVPGAATGEKVAYAIALLAPVVLAVMLAIVRPTKGRSRRFKLLYIPGVLIAQVAVSVALFAGAFTLDFGGDLVATVRSPDGAHTAYLYEGGIMCGYGVSVAKAGERYMHSVGGYGMRCDAQGGYTIRWSSPSQIELTSGINVVKTFSVE
jgi:hypothetical protein